MNSVTTFCCALILGTGLSVGLERLSSQERLALQLPRVSARWKLIRGCAIVVATAFLFALFRWASLEMGCLETAEVQPSWTGRHWRLAYHFALFGLLILATAIDFDCYTIPDIITIPGMIFGVFGACLIGEVQICHLWVDWSTAVPQLRGPFIPAWYDAHRNLHGFAWSVTGLIVGAGLTWLARFLSSRVLGQEAMGFGDVTLMGMIGSFLGWQAVTLVFLTAPLTGLIFGILIRTISGKTFLPYGPWLSIAAVTTLFAWNSLWRQTRLIFSDWLSVAVLGGVGGVGFVLLLILIQLYKSIPTRHRAT